MPVGVRRAHADDRDASRDESSERRDLVGGTVVRDLNDVDHYGRERRDEPLLTLLFEISKREHLSASRRRPSPRRLSR